MNTGNENTLLAALKTGSTQAFETLYKENVQLLWGEAYRILGGRQMADDAVQELFIEIWEKKLYEKVESNIRGYLFTCIRRKCYKINGNKKTFEEISTAVAPAQSYHQPGYDSKALNKEIADAMAEMPLQSSKVFELYVLEGKKRKEVAKELGISDNTAKSYLATALKIVRKRLLKFKNDTPI